MPTPALATVVGAPGAGAKVHWVPEIAPATDVRLETFPEYVLWVARPTTSNKVHGAPLLPSAVDCAAPRVEENDRGAAVPDELEGNKTPVRIRARRRTITMAATPTTTHTIDERRGADDAM